MDPFYIKQELNRDMCNNFEPCNEYDFKTGLFKSEEEARYAFFEEPIKYQFYTDNYNQKNLMTNNFLNAMLKQESQPEAESIAKDIEESEDEDFELRLSDTSAEGEDDARDESTPDLSAVADKLNDIKINEPPSSSKVKRKRTSSKVNNVTPRETPTCRKSMRQTSLLSFLNVSDSPSVETNKKSRTPRNAKVTPATTTIGTVEMIKIKSARVVLERLPVTSSSPPKTNVQDGKSGTTKSMYRHCDKCNKDYPNLGLTTNSHCTRCSGSIAFRCGQCSKIYRSLSGMRYHLESLCPLLKEFKEFRCGQCDYVSTAKQLLQRHEKSAHKARISCEKCRMSFVDEDTLKRHQMLQCPKKNEMHCNECDFKTKSLIQFKGHQAMHANSEKVSPSTADDSLVQPYCKTCENSMAKSRYAKKCYKCKMTLSFQCTTCHLTFATKREAQSHAKIHISHSVKKPKSTVDK